MILLSSRHVSFMAENSVVHENIRKFERVDHQKDWFARWTTVQSNEWEHDLWLVNIISDDHEFSSVI